MSAFSEIFRKAHGALNSLRGNNNYFMGKDGEIVFSKNNVCVHEVGVVGEESEDNIIHIPGYLTVHCANDDATGITLVLQWLPNKTLEKNPASIRCVSPRNRAKERTEESNGRADVSSNFDIKIKKHHDKQDNEDLDGNTNSNDVSLEIDGDMVAIDVKEDSETVRPSSFNYKFEKTNSHGTGNHSKDKKENTGLGIGAGLFVPSINVIPNTPVEIGDNFEQHLTISGKDEDTHSQSSVSTSGADELSEKDEHSENSSSCDNTDDESGQSVFLDSYRANCASLVSSTPEGFAKAHNLILVSESKSEEECSVAVDRGRAIFQTPVAHNASLFSVNLGKMRSMRLFYSNSECNSGQLVIASLDSQYKILHFHHGGLNKLAHLFEQWNVVKGRGLKDGSPSPVPDRHLLIYHPEVQKVDMDPEDGIYEKVSNIFWKSYKSGDGSIEDSFTLRKSIFFASMEPTLRREIWPFLLRVYPWTSTLDQRESIRNDLFLEYQKLKKRTLQRANSTTKFFWTNVETMITKDVVRTDRKNDFYAGDNNPNLEVMKNILMNYAISFPNVNYIQGMSDLLAPILRTIGEEADTYWCFVGLMQQTLFVPFSKNENNMMEKNLDYLRELMQVLLPDFYKYLKNLGDDAIQLMFVHRWLLLFFKREFAEDDAMHIWEACWSRYRTTYFHLFISIAIVSIYSPDIMQQGLPNDEILLYFSSLANHLDASVVLKKARGLLYKFCRMEKIPCTLAGIVDHDQTDGQWNSHMPQQVFECTKFHGSNELCPYAS
uniref:Rab-GAP TBC domain-containing protein n=1 Tax=Rhabditophanes sp. KR3021 TaxID=114890 RepID=A0AC35U4G2_9BILA